MISAKLTPAISLLHKLWLQMISGLLKYTPAVERTVEVLKIFKILLLGFFSIFFCWVSQYLWVVFLLPMINYQCMISALITTLAPRKCKHTNADITNQALD